MDDDRCGGFPCCSVIGDNALKHRDSCCNSMSVVG